MNVALAIDIVLVHNWYMPFRVEAILDAVRSNINIFRAYALLVSVLMRNDCSNCWKGWSRIQGYASKGSQETPATERRWAIKELAEELTKVNSEEKTLF